MVNVSLSHRAGFRQKAMIMGLVSAADPDVGSHRIDHGNALGAWRKRSELSALELMHSVFRRYVILRSGWEWEVPTPFNGNSISENYQLRVLAVCG